ncbi:hypothetical protein JMJ35_000870 [Cladonia borealis]|uniref:Uncharacterized protein n=1 Tax=Cladonia borealis TaxID=184061 RepID=A0AA39V4Z0_9LECA|nr:hypothetical protein JMJ35_000870 [Cladonia borealis]
MPSNVDTWLHSRRDELARFTHVELQAEILRQQIAELESFDIPSPTLTLLRTKLSAISESAALTSQGRSYQQQLIAMAMEARETGQVPDGDAQMTVLRGYKAWLNKMEEADRVDLRNRFEGKAFREYWQASSWRGRRELLRAYGEIGAAGVGNIARWKLTKVAVRWLLWVGRR